MAGLDELMQSVQVKSSRKKSDDDFSEDYVPPNFNRRPRSAIQGESFNPEKFLKEEIAVSYPKTESESHLLHTVLRSMFMFRSLSKHELEVVVNAMFRRETHANEHVIDQGEDGDNFYVIEKGVFFIFVNGNNVGSYNNSGSFGELALMYNCPRAATILSVGEGILWCLDRITFRQILLKHAFAKRSQYESFLRSIPLLESLSEEERGRLADALEPVDYHSGDLIIRQGDVGDSFYFIVAGNVNCVMTVDKAQVVVAMLGPGNYFGELSLLTSKPRAASVIASSPSVSCARLRVDAFERLLGPCKMVLRRNMHDYEARLYELFGERSKELLDLSE